MLDPDFRERLIYVDMLLNWALHADREDFIIPLQQLRTLIKQEIAKREYDNTTS